MAHWLTILVLGGLGAVAPSIALAQDAGGARVPPRVLEATDAVYPADVVRPEEDAVVTLHVTIEVDGTASDAHPEGEHDEALAAAALEAVRRWRFAPATVGGEPVRSRIRVEVRFAPAPAVAEAPAEPSAAAVPEAEEIAAHDDAPPEAELGVEAIVDPLTLAAEPRSVSEHVLDRRALEGAPRRDAADLLTSVPGFYVAHEEGDGVAQSVFLRGFEAEHGQDVELTLGGVPLNLPSHLHGQGYADLGVLVPEAVLGLRVSEGIYDPRQGDFALAGSADFTLGVPSSERGVRLSASAGSFDTFRALALLAPPGEHEGSVVAASFRTTSGYGAQRGGTGGSLVAQWVFGADRLRVRVLGLLSGGRYRMAGVVRRDDVEAGRIDFLGVYAFPTAAAQGAFTLRALGAVTASILHDGGSFTELGVWASYADFRLLENFTGFLGTTDDGRTPGDLLEQRDEHASVGLRARWRSEAWAPWEWASARLEVGLSGRLDVISQAQRRLEAPSLVPWERSVDAGIRGGDVALYADLDVRLTDHVRLRGGVRGAALFYDVEDRLGSATDPLDPTGGGYRRSAAGLVALPRAAVEVRPIPELALTVAYGEGYRSPQARQLRDGEAAPYTIARTADLGARLRLDGGLLDASASGFVTYVGSDLAFDPEEGRLEALGPTTRLGFAAAVWTRPWDFLTGSLSVTYVHATLDGPPPGSTEPFPPGQRVPYVPPLVLRADVSADGAMVRLGDHDLEARGSAGFSFLSERPLFFDAWAAPVALLDASAGVGWGPISFDVTVFNVTDARYAATEQAFVSSWSPGATPSDVPARHVIAGAPLTVLATLALSL